jgi:hypothetical protein
LARRGEGYIRFAPLATKLARRRNMSRRADAVEKVENRTTPKISQMVIGGLPRRCDAL